MVSRSNAIKKLGHNPIIFEPKDSIKSFDKIIIPGVGAYPLAIKRILRTKFYKEYKNFLKKKSILGICLGMQLFFKDSNEFKKTKGLGLIDSSIMKLNFLPKIPNIGYCKIEIERKNQLFKNIKNASYFYFMHSYGMPRSKKDFITSNVKYKKKMFVSSIKFGNLYGVQFHPEKSGKIGLKLLGNFLNE